MKAIILAAGYGVRLSKELEDLRKSNPEKYEELRDSTEGRAKPMVLIAGKPVVQYAVENIERTGEIDGIIIITNNRYHSQFEEWKDSYSSRVPIKLLNDGTNRNEQRLGAVNDLLLVLREENIDDDVLVFAGDNLLKIELKEIIDFFRDRQTSIIVAYKESDKSRLRKSACIEIDENSLVIGFEEKPSEPRSEWICPSVYIYASDTIKLIKEMKFDKDKGDLIGNIPLLLYSRIHIHAFTSQEKIRFDLGTVQDIKKAEEYFGGKQ